MSKFYEIQPFDTLFFRGATPMEAGLMNAVSMFPPSESVIKGAFWTSYCNETDKSFSEGLIDEKIPFDVEGFFIKKNEKFYIPCPTTWYYDSEKKVSLGKELNGKKLVVAKDCSEIMNNLGMSSSAGKTVFVKPEIDAQPLLGAWVCVDYFKNPNRFLSDDAILFSKEIFSFESRTGVALDENRKAKEGQLYSSSHVRLNEDVSFVIQFSDDIDISDKGIISLGGEKRLSNYERIDGPSLEFIKDDEQYLSLMPIEATKENLESVISSGKLIVTSGWDLAKGFHKPTTNWIPAGAVFNKKINNSCVAITQTK
jgi:CRISPR-associated protein Cmr3